MMYSSVFAVTDITASISRRDDLWRLTYFLTLILSRVMGFKILESFKMQFFKRPPQQISWSLLVHITYTPLNYGPPHKSRSFIVLACAILLILQRMTQNLNKTVLDSNISQHSTVILSIYHLHISLKSNIRFHSIQSSRRGDTDERVNLWLDTHQISKSAT